MAAEGGESSSERAIAQSGSCLFFLCCVFFELEMPVGWLILFCLKNKTRLKIYGLDVCNCILAL